jgi:hypothetical protein
MNTEHELFGEQHEQEENGLFGNEHRRQREAQQEALRLSTFSCSLPSDDKIVSEAIQAARKVDSEVGLLPSNNDIKMFCLGAKWMRDLAQGNDR